MKTSELKSPTNDNPHPKGPIEGFGPRQFRNLNKSLLSKYSFEDNDLSRTSQLISQLNQDQEDWLRLEIKEITSIGKELITFYLMVKYLVEYQDEIGANFEKKKGQKRQSESIKEIKEVKSKLVHGSILQTQHKNLVLNLKCKKQQFLPFGSKPFLTRLQFKIMRTFQTNTQAILLSRQIITNPQTNAQYQIAFQQLNPPPNTKTKSVISMTFEINGAIKQEIEGSEQNEESLSDSREVSEHLEGEEDEEKYENYTLGKSQSIKRYHKKKPLIQPNIFDNSNHQKSQHDPNINNHSHLQQQSDLTSNHNNSYLSNKKQSSSNAQLIHKLNELSNMMDENLEKSKNQDQAYKSYLQETSNMIEMFNNGNEEGKVKGNANYAQNFSNPKNKQTQSKNKPSVIQVKHNNTNIKQSTTQPQPSQNPNSNNNKTIPTSNLNDTSLGQRYNYVSRIQNTYIAGQRFQYESRINNSNSANTDNEKYNYFSRAQITNNNTVGEKYTTVSKGDDSNIVGERYNYESSKMDDTNLVGERYNQQSRIQNSNILDQSNLNDLSAISPVQPNSPIMQKKSSLSKKEPFLKFNSKRQNNLVDNSPNRGTNQNPTSSRNVPFNLGDLDSSNIRYQYNDNDVSNIQETKNMQELINQIQKIQKEWYEKRVLNRKNRQEKKQNNNEIQDQDNKLKPFDMASNPDDVLDLELKNFKIKFSQQTFCRKLIDGLKRKHQTYAKRNQTNENGQSEIPKNYLVFLIANEVDDENMDYDAGNTSKIQIKIPSQQIDKLLQLQSIEKQRSLSNSGSNGLPPSMSKIQQKEIIKAFQKQIFSKVMKIKLSKNDKNVLGEKKKARIIQIALEDQSLTLSQMQIEGTMKDPQQNRISLVGMYPLPIFGSQNKDGQTSFYQNVSIEPLAIELYDTKTGAQEGQLKFELTKAKVDREIQTLEPLENMDEPYESNRDDRNERAHQENSTLLVGYEVQEDKNIPQSLASSNEPLKRSQTESKLKQRLLEIEIVQPFGKGTPTNMKTQQKHANRQLKIQSQASHPFLFKSEQIPSKQQRNDQELLSSISKVKPKSIYQGKVSQSQYENRSPKKEKDVDNIGKIIKNQSSTLIEVHPVVVDKDNESNVKTITKQNNSPDQKPKLVPELHMSNIRKVQDPNAVRRNDNHSPVKFYNTSIRPHQVCPNSPSSINEKNDPQSDSSYFLMKKQFLATANMLQSIKMKAQQFIEKVESERKIHTSDELHSDKEGWKGFESQGESKVAYTLPIQRKAINLGVTSFVVNQTVLSRRQVSRNMQTLAQPSSTPQTVPINPVDPKGTTNNLHSKRTSTNKSRNSKVDPTVVQPRRNKFVVSPDKQSQSLRSRQKNHENSVQSNGSALQGYQKKSKRREKAKKALVYKEESDYQFTEQEGKVRKRSKENKPYHPSSKILDHQQQSDMSHQLQSSGLNDSHLPSNSYPKGTLNPRPRNIKQSAISSYSQSPVIQIKLFSLKIKLLSLPLVAKHLRNLSQQEIPKGKDYFVLVYTDFTQRDKGSEESLGFMRPVSQKCVKKKLGKEDEFVVLFGDSNKEEEGVKGKTSSYGYLLLKGVEKTKFVVELYQSQPIPVSQKSTEKGQKDVTSLQHISLITLSPQHKKPKTKPFASLSVTYIELLAQQQSGGFTSRLEKSDLITYTNFLYEKEKILGKININYITNLQDQNDQGSRYQGSRQKNKLSASRKQAIEQFKPLENSYFKNYPDSKKQSLSQKDGLKKLRSESGMTKKLTPRRKIQARRSEDHSYNQRNNLPVSTLGNQADPLQILKRKVPRLIKSQEKSKKNSLSYAIRLNRPYHTPMNKIKGKDLFDSLHSSSSAQFKADKIRERKHKNSVYSSSQFEGEGFIESPKKGQDNAQLMQLRQKKQQKKLKRLKEYQAASRIPIPYQTQETRLSQNRRYGGGNIKFGKSSRFNSADSQQALSKKESKAEIPGPGHYEVKSIFDRHMIKEP